MTKEMSKGNNKGMLTPEAAAERALASLEKSMEFSTYESQGNFGGEFTQKYIFTLMPTGFVQSMMAK